MIWVFNPVFTCILALSATYFGSFARRALVGSRTPMIWCLSNARSGDLHFGTSFVALRALVREIIPNTIPTYIHDPSRISIDCLTPASRLRRSASISTSCGHLVVYQTLKVSNIYPPHGHVAIAKFVGGWVTWPDLVT